MYVKKILERVMLLVGAISACNLFTLYLFPLIIPMANFSIIKLSFIAIAEKKYGYILISCMLVILILVGAASIIRNHILLLILSVVIYLGDLIHVGYLFVLDLLNSYFNTVIICSGIVDIIIIVLFSLYKIKKTGDGSLS